MINRFRKINTGASPTVIAAALVLLLAGPVLAQHPGHSQTAAGVPSTQINPQPPSVHYYTCAMHPNIHVSPAEYAKGAATCPVCKMDLIPVAAPASSMSEGAPTQAGAQVSAVTIPRPQLDVAGVRTEPVQLRHLFKTIRAAGTVAYDPQLAVAQDEFLAAVHAREKARASRFNDIKEQAADLERSSEVKLRLLGLSDSQIKDLKDNPAANDDLLLPGKTAWIYADAYEYESPWVKEGAPVTVTAAALPGETWQGTIRSVNPVLDPQTRTIRFRTQVDNPGKKLRPNMYVDVFLSSHYTADNGEVLVLAVPKSAVLDTGIRKVVWVQTAPEAFQGRHVTLGPLCAAKEGATEFYPVLSGLREGENVVTEGNFLIDSQSRLTGVAASAYGGALGSEGSGAEPKTPPAHQH